MPESLRAAITGIGATVPERILTNEDLEKIVDTSDEWITQRTGIKERHIVSDDESTATLAIQSAKQALDDAGVAPTDLDMIICATVSPEMPFPATACLVQDALGATDVPAFDISAACSGFVYELIIARQFIENGTYRRILIIAADALSRITDYTDRGSCILFGDAAGAAVLEPTERNAHGLIYTVMHANGAGWDFIHIPAGGARKPTSIQTVEAHEHFMKLRGRDVYRFAVEKMQWLLGDCLDKCGLSVDDVDLVIPHQVNERIISSAAGKLNYPMDKVYVNIDRYGNTSGASIPLALAEARQKGLISAGSTVIMIAFGAGLTWAGAVVKL